MRLQLTQKEPAFVFHQNMTVEQLAASTKELNNHRDLMHDAVFGKPHL